MIWMVNHAPLGFNAPAPLRQRARYDFINLIRPDHEVYTVEQRFQIYRWMVATAKAIKPTREETGRWGVMGPIALLSKQPSCIDDYYGPGPICSLDDLKKRFQYALFAWAGPSAARWRAENGISVNTRKILSFPHYLPYAGAPLNGKPTCEADIEKALEKLLDSGGNLTTHLNSCHAGAIEIQSVVVKVRPEGFDFILRYGVDGSSWDYTLAATPRMWEGEGETFRRNPYGRGSEPFLHTMGRAITTMARLTEPKGTETRVA
jgi:hypothetical protein